MVRHLIWGKAPAAKIHATPVSMPRMTGLLSRGMSAGHSESGGGGSRRLNTAGGGMDAFNDPVVTGQDYEKNPDQHGILGLLNNGKISEGGQNQQALHGRYQQAMQAYQQALDGGASQQQALAQVVRADPGFLSDVLVSHPAALKAFQTAGDIHDFMAGKQAEPIFGNFDAKTGQQPKIDPATGQVVGVNKVEGWETPAGKAAPVHWSRGPNGELQGTTVGPNGFSTQTATNANGSPTTLAPTGKQPLANGWAPGADNLPAQPGDPTGPVKNVNALDLRAVAATPAVINAMKDIQAKAGQLGIAKGYLAVQGGKLLGVNGQGADISADLDIIKANAKNITGAGYKAPMENFMEAITTTYDAPSFINKQIPQMIDSLQTDAQSKADNMVDVRGARLDPPLNSALMSVGVFPKGTWTPENFAKAGPSATGAWKLRAGYDANMTPAESNAVMQDALQGKYGPMPTNDQPLEKQSLSPMMSKITQHAQNLTQQPQQQQNVGASRTQAADAQRVQQDANTMAVTLATTPNEEQPPQEPGGGDEQQSSQQPPTEDIAPSAAQKAPQGEATVAPNAAPPKPAPAPAPAPQQSASQSGTDAQGNPYGSATLQPAVSPYEQEQGP